MNARAATTTERREADRLPLRCPVQIRVPGLGPVRAQVVNLSTHGLLVTLGGQIPLGLEVRLSIELPGGQQPLEVAALGVRIERDEPGGPSLRMGFQFIHAPPATLRRIEELVFGA